MRTGAFLVFLAVFAAGAAPLRAQDYPPQRWEQRDHARERVQDGEIMPLDRLLPSIRRDHPGTFYDAQGPFPGANGDYQYRLKWMTPDGRVMWLDTDARTGRVIREPRKGSNYFQERYGRDRGSYGAPPPATYDRPGYQSRGYDRHGGYDQGGYDRGDYRLGRPEVAGGGRGNRGRGHKGD
jgi:hypothetical protein